MNTTRKLIGHVSVDSGQVLIVDPCYLGTWSDGEMGSPWEVRMERVMVGDEAALNNYDECCCASLSDNRAGQVFGRSAVASSTLYGDGQYPVYADYTEEGIARLVIEFGDEDGEEEEDG